MNIKSIYQSLIFRRRLAYLLNLFEFMKVVLEDIVDCLQFRQEDVDGLRFAVLEKGPKLGLVELLPGLYGLQHLCVLLIFLKGKEGKLVLLAVPALDGLIQLFRLVLQPVY